MSLMDDVPSDDLREDAFARISELVKLCERAMYLGTSAERSYRLDEFVGIQGRLQEIKRKWIDDS